MAQAIQVNSGLATSAVDLQMVTAALESARRRVATLEAPGHEAAPALAAGLVETYRRGRRRHAQVLFASVSDSRALGRLIRGAQALASIERARVAAHRVGQVGPPAMSRTGSAAVYFELRVDGRPVDALQWLRSSP